MSHLEVPLGQFRLHRPIGTGGAGDVWQGVHVRQDVPVAVKVITAARARDPRYHEAFRNEVQAVAGLDHPGIVTVFDVGEVDAIAERASHGRMVAGSPYLAMELARHGSLRGPFMPRSWADLRAALLWLLDILAHAHAQGVIHRDLKPGNVLIFEEGVVAGDLTGASRLRLTDFGLAHASHRDDRSSKGTSGTPAYMAPEQFRGAWRSFGPWTDLYSLGCMAYEMATGGPPFSSQGIYALMQDHLFVPTPTLEARYPVPAGFDGWIKRLMHKEPEVRFQRAADASWALVRMGEPDGEAIDVGSLELEFEDLPTEILGPTVVRSWPDWEKAFQVRREQMEQLSRLARPPEVLHDRRVPPLPSTWRRSTKTRLSMQLVGAGLGLYGLRAIPLVDRESERDTIWSALHEVRSTGDVRVVVLQGGAGVGKSRLVEWIAQRADEVGSAMVLRAVHSPTGGPADGLSRMLLAALGGQRLSRSDLQDRLEAWLKARLVFDPDEFRAILELLWPLPQGGTGRAVRFGSADERWALILRLLGYLAGEPDPDGARRPVVLWLDDVQWGNDALGFLGYRLQRAVGQTVPLLVLATVRDEALPDRPAEAALLDRALTDARVWKLNVGPLSADGRRELVRNLLHLGGELAAQVEARTAGNPLFAVQLVGDWVSRGVLEVGPTGFELRSGDNASLPDNIHQMWEDRLDKALQGLGPDARAALELGALMGTDLDTAEWRGACQVAGLELPLGLVGRLVAQRLARESENTWSFAHGMLRESLERSAKERGQSRRLHLAIATMLQIRYEASRQPGLAERLGRHLFFGGRPEEALAPLHQGALEHRAMSDLVGTVSLLDLRERVLRELALPLTDARWGDGWVSRADLLIGQGQLTRAAEVATQAVEHGHEPGWDRILPAALRHLATSQAKRGRLDEAIGMLHQAEQVAKSRGFESELARIELFLGEVERLRGHHGQAIPWLQRAMERFTVLEDQRGQADTLAGFAAAYRSMGDPDRAERYAREALLLFQAVGGRFGIGSAQNTLGDILRARGELEKAEESYWQSADLLRRIGSPEHFIPLLNLGLSQLARREYGSAGEVFDQVLAVMLQTGRAALVGAVHAFLMPCVAHKGDAQAFEAHSASAAEILARTGFVDDDVAEAAELAAGLAGGLGWSRHADRAWTIASAQWIGLGKLGRSELAKLHIGRDVSSDDSLA